jgi:hypothetical protein
MADYTKVHPAGPFTSTASAAITGGQLVEVTGVNTVGPAGAGSIKVVGQACHDAASGADVTVDGDYAIREAVVAGAGVVAGVRLKAAAAGAVALYVDGTDAVTLVVGVALNTAADTATVRYQGR